MLSRRFHGFAFALAVFLTLLAPHPASARKATPDDVGSVIEFDRRRFDVKADGRYTFRGEYQIRIVNENGRDSQSEQALAFNSGASTLRVLAARVIGAEGRAVDVPKRNIELREAGESIKFFDTQKQMIISFPNVRIGSRIFVSYEIRFSEVPAPGQFSATVYADRALTEAMSVEIVSDRPLARWASDPGRRFAFESDRVGTRFREVAKSVKPLDLAIVDEDFQAFDPAGETVFSYSTVKAWGEYAPSLIAEIEKLTSARLPESLAGIVAQVDRRAPVVDQLNRVTSLMNEEFRYFGDWRRRNGTHAPRSLESVAESRYGDCKDLSLVAAALFRALGFKAYQAWIYRGEEPYNPRAYELPSDALFNHAVTYVEAGGKAYWVDPTNAVSFAQGIFVDIADRPAFVLNPEKPALIDTPTMRAEESAWSSDIRLEVAGNGEVKAKGTVRSSGRMAILMTSNNFFHSPESNDYWLIRSISGSERVVGFKVGDYERRSRVVGDLAIDVEYRLEDIGLRTSAGLGFPLARDPVVDAALVDARDRLAGIWLGAPKTGVQRFEIANVRKVGNENLDCSIESPWAKFSRRVRATPRGVSITDRVESLRKLIPVADHRSPEFAAFQKRVKDCFYRAAVVLQLR